MVILTHLIFVSYIPSFLQFLAFDTQMLLGNKRYAISPEEYIFATLSLYLDIIYLFSFLLQIMGGGRDWKPTHPSATVLTLGSSTWIFYLHEDKKTSGLYGSLIHHFNALSLFFEARAVCLFLVFGRANLPHNTYYLTCNPTADFVFVPWCSLYSSCT